MTYKDHEAASHEGEAARALFPDRATGEREVNRRWKLIINPWDLPIRQIDPHRVEP